MRIFGTDYDGVIINIEPQKSAAFGELLKKHWGVNKKEVANFWISGGEHREDINLTISIINNMANDLLMINIIPLNQNTVVF